MEKLVQWLRGAGRIVFRRRVERDVDDELRFHVDMATDEYVRSGLAPAEARRRAALEFGGVERAREESRDALGVGVWAHLGQDVRYAIRTLRKSPVFTSVAVLVLALGIGLNSAILSVVVGVFLGELPFPDADRIARLTGTIPRLGWTSAALGIPEIRDIEAACPGLDDVAIYASSTVTVGSQHDVERVEANFVSPAYFDVLRVEPRLGGLFTRETEAGPAARHFALLSEAFWLRRYGGDGNVIGRTLRVDGETFTIVGVLPATFRDMISRWSDVDVWLPLGRGAPIFYENMYENRRHRVYGAVARLESAASFGAVQSEIDAAMAQLAIDHPAENKDRGARIEPLRDYFFGTTVQPVTILFAGSALVLGICCINLLSLTLVRSEARRREIGLRSALGAGRWRLVRQLLTESVLLTVAGASLGIVVADVCVRALVSPVTLGMPTFAELRVDPTVVALSILVAAVANVVFGLYPAVRHSSVDPLEAMGSGQRAVGGGPATRRSWSMLLVVEATVAVVLLVGAGLTAKSLYRLANTPMGFATDDLVTLRTELAGETYATWEPRARFGERLVRELEGSPAVDAVSVWAPSMLGFAGWHEAVTPIEIDAEDPANQTPIQRLHVTPGSLRTVGIALLRGRDFTWNDRHEKPRVAIVSRKLAERLWPGEDAVGRRLWVAAGWEATVVGVAAEALHRGKLAPATTVAGDVYFAFLQWPQPSVSVLARTDAPQVAADELARAIGRLDPELAVFDVAMMADRLRRAESLPRFVALLMAIYAGVALLLASVGTYGVVAYTASQRRGEIAVRLAIGAPRRRLLWLVFAQGVRPVLGGVLLGLASAFLLARFVTGILFGTSAGDPAIYLTVALALSVTAALACYLPARRATGIDPIHALRCE